jgi:hypothetical protein
VLASAIAASSHAHFTSLDISRNQLSGPALRELIAIAFQLPCTFPCCFYVYHCIYSCNTALQRVCWGGQVSPGLDGDAVFEFALFKIQEFNSNVLYVRCCCWSPLANE